MFRKSLRAHASMLLAGVMCANLGITSIYAEDEVPETDLIVEEESYSEEQKDILCNAICITAVGYCGEFDGQEHFGSVTTNVEGVTLKYSVNGGSLTTTAPSIKDVGVKAVVVHATREGYIPAVAEYNLVVTPAAPSEVELSATGYSGAYDGQVHKGIVSVVPEDVELCYLVNGIPTLEEPTIKDVGKKCVVVIAKKCGYQIACAQYTLEVTPADVLVKADEKSKVFGQEDPELTATVTGVAEGEQVEYTLSRDEGETAGTYTIHVCAKPCQGCGNYRVSTEDSVFTIKPQSINPKDDDYLGVKVSQPTDVLYNGLEQKQEVTVTDGNGNALTADDYDITYEGDVTNAGVVKVHVNGKGNYTGENTVSYNILQRKITFESGSASKVYDGTALTKDGITISGDGFVEGEGATILVTGKQTKVGSSKNTIEYTFDDGVNGNNYNVTLTEGTLTVKAKKQEPKKDEPKKEETVKATQTSVQTNLMKALACVAVSAAAILAIVLKLRKKK